MRRLCAALIAFGVLVAACSTKTATFPRHGETCTPSAAKCAKPSYGGTIPLSVAIPRIEAFVQTERGLTFKHKVKVTLLSDKAFVAKLRSTQGGDDAKDAEKLLATLSSLGLISPKTDLLKAFHDAYDAGTLGFYDFKSKQLYVRGNNATPGVQAVLSHELTHALTDQWFGLDRKGLDKDNQELGLAFTALAEGDAERTRMAFESKLSSGDQAAAKKEEDAGGVPKVPQVVLQIIGFPYASGPEFVNAVVQHGGLKALDAAYKQPPVSSEQILEPDHYFAHDLPRHVPYPRADAAVLDKGDLGLIGLFLALAHALGQPDAATGIRGWGGDEFVTWKAGAQRYCMRDSIVMDDSEATTRLHTALAQWAHQSNGRLRVEESGTRSTFVSCSS